MKAALAIAALNPWVENGVVHESTHVDSFIFGKVPEPSSDPFYNYTGPLDQYTNGHVLRWREVTLEHYTDVASAYQLLYRTESALGDPESTVTTVIIPENNDNETIISYQIAEDASSLDCDPSYELETSSAQTAIQRIINGGHVVISPDYEGAKSTFAAGIHEGKLTLDSVRATLSARSQIGNFANDRVALWGYSGGSIATGWATELREKYAPDVNITVTAVGGYVTNLTATLEAVNGTPLEGFVPPALVGLGEAYPELYEQLKSHIKSYELQFVLSTRTRCLSQDLVQYLGANVFDFFDDGEKILQLPLLKQVLDDNTLGLHNTPSTPWYIYQGSIDEIAPPAQARRAANFYCANGGSVVYDTIEGFAHLVAEQYGEQSAYDYISKAFAGQITDGCRNITSGLVQG